MTAGRRSIDAEIDAARARGDFDDLPGRGKPLALDDMEGLSTEERFQALLMRSLREALPEVTLIREIRDLRKQLSSSPSAQPSLQAELEDKLKQLREALKARREDV